MLCSLHAQRRGVGRVDTGVGGERLGQTEVEDLQLTVARHLDVGGFQVPVDNAFAVRRLEGFGNLNRQLQGLFNRNRAPGDALGKRISFHQFHDEEVSVVVFLESMNGRDVGMVERRKQFGFTFKPGETIGVLSKLRR